MNNKVWESPVLTSATGRKWNGNSQENGNAGNGNGNGWGKEMVLIVTTVVENIHLDNVLLHHNIKIELYNKKVDYYNPLFYFLFSLKCMCYYN